MLSLDRLAANTNNIRNAASSSLPPSPFTNAILNASIPELIRDVHPTELGLFTPELSRVEFHGPAPRKKQDPEVYAHAALTYIERYHKVRPMPRAHAQVVAILDQLAATRDNIRDLTAILEQIQPSELKPLADREGKRVQELQARLADLKQRKAAAATKSKPRTRPPKPVPVTPSTPVQSTSTQKLDETFHTPAAAARTLHFTDNLLMDEQIDLSDVSISSPSRFHEQHHDLQENDPGQSIPDFQENVPEPQETLLDPQEEEPDSQENDVGTAEESTDDATIVLATEPAVASPVRPVISETPKKGKVRVNSEVERIVAKMWSCIGDLIMPGHSFDPSGSGTGDKPPRAKETIAHLQSVTTLTPTPSSPSTTISSLTAPATNTATPQQILTAHLLLTLLATGPHFSMPLNQVKDVLAAKANSNGGAGGVLAGQSTTRVLYACVAKRLVKIERGGGEQIVKFDV